MTGKVVVKYKYDAWGECKIEYPEDATMQARIVGACNPFLYRGYYYCAELGLYYLKSRFYDPTIGRFISADSLEYIDPHTVGGVNLFAYCNNNPVMNVDPTGHMWMLRLGVTLVRLFCEKNKIKDFIQALSNEVGAVVSVGKEVPDIGSPITKSPFTSVETGVGYNKDFGNSKSVNFFLEGSGFHDASVGLDARVNGFGAGVEIGTGKSAVTAHFGDFSLEIGYTGARKAYVKEVYEINGGYVYRKSSIDLIRLALALAPVAIAATVVALSGPAAAFPYVAIAGVLC